MSKTYVEPKEIRFSKKNIKEILIEERVLANEKIFADEESFSIYDEKMETDKNESIKFQLKLASENEYEKERSKETEKTTETDQLEELPVKSMEVGKRDAILKKAILRNQLSPEKKFNEETTSGKNFFTLNDSNESKESTNLTLTDRTANPEGTKISYSSKTTYEQKINKKFLSKNKSKRVFTPTPNLHNLLQTFGSPNEIKQKILEEYGLSK